MVVLQKVAHEELALALRAEKQTESERVEQRPHERVGKVNTECAVFRKGWRE